VKGGHGSSGAHPATTHLKIGPSIEIFVANACKCGIPPLTLKNKVLLNERKKRLY
jgi:hypothetical protein